MFYKPGGQKLAWDACMDLHHKPCFISSITVPQDAHKRLVLQVAEWLTAELASSPGPSQILSLSHGEKSGEGLGAKLCHGPEMVDSVST